MCSDTVSLNGLGYLLLVVWDVVEVGLQVALLFLHVIMIMMICDSLGLLGKADHFLRFFCDFGCG